MPIKVRSATTSAASSATDTNLIETVVCDSGVAVGDWVRMNGSDVAVGAQADSIANANVFGVVESKDSSTVCNIRIGGISTAIFSGLDQTTEYFLDVTTAGAMATLPPGLGSGGVAISLGKPFSATKFAVNITNLRTQR